MAETILTLSSNSPSSISILHWPFSSTGRTLSSAPLRSQRSCQGTIFEWCSHSETSTTSPLERNLSPYVLATRLIDAVVPDVIITSSLLAALMYCLTASLPPSYKSVASALNLWTARCILALIPPFILWIRSRTARGFCAVAALSK